MNEDKFLKVAKQAALEAGVIVQKYSNKKLSKLPYKREEDVSNFATKADIKSEEFIVQTLKKNFPNHNIIAEEQTQLNNDSQFTWVIDPLDGTFAFSLGVPFYCVSIGLLKNGKPFLGVIYHTSFKNLYWARVKDGAYLNGKKINVSKRDKLDEAGVNLDRGHRYRRPAKIDLYIAPLMTKVGYDYSLGGAGAIQGMVAQGILDGYVGEAWLWDFVAGAVVIREAGGKVTDFEGNEPDWSKERLSIVASNGLIHDQILKALSASLRGTK